LRARHRARDPRSEDHAVAIKALIVLRIPDTFGAPGSDRHRGLRGCISVERAEVIPAATRVQGHLLVGTPSLLYLIEGMLYC